MSVSYEEMQDSPQEGWDQEGGFTATRTLMCEYDDRHTLAAELMGTLYEQRPAFLARAYNIGIKPFGAKMTAPPGNSVALYEKALLVVQHKFMDQDPEDMVSESIEPNAEFMTLDHQNFRWTNANGALLEEAEAPGRLVKSLDYIYTRHQVPILPPNLLDFVGKVNDRAIAALVLNQTFAAETLLFTPPTPSRKITTEQVEAWTVPMRFSYQPAGWNKFWRNATQSYEEIWSVEANAVHKNHETANFAGIML
jgi:hypothetical protein